MKTPTESCNEPELPDDYPITKAETICIDGKVCLDVRCNLSGCVLEQDITCVVPAT